MSDVDLLRAYEPIVRFTEGELFFPVAVEEYVACCDLLERAPGVKPVVVLSTGEVTLDRLAELGAARAGPGLFLRFVSNPFTWTRLTKWRHRGDRPHFRRSGRLARVGVLSRIVDALMRLSLAFRGSVARGTEAAGETLYRKRMRADHNPYYGRVIRSAGYVALQYWFFYPFNDWRSRAYGVNDHEADWEQVVVYLAEQSDATTRPAWVVFSAHDETGDDLRRRWDDPDLTLIGDHPVVNAGLGSHSGAYLAGEYLTTLDSPAFHRLIRVYRGISRALLPWTREQAHAGVGIPYVDYSRGDGTSIGPGQDREWAPVVIDDETPWVFDYQGLWGNDTEDPFGGERAPAGPRYERSGAVRPQWGDVVGWSGLAKVAPNPVLTDELVRQRLDDLQVEAETNEADLDQHRTTLRADVASGVTVTPTQEQQLNELSAKGVTLHDEQRRLRARLTNPPPPPGPHDHLRHRRFPTPPEPRIRRRILAIWSAFSTPLILTLIGLAFLPGASMSLVGLTVFGLFGLLVIEAIAHRNLVRFLITLVTLGVALAVVSTVAGMTVYFGWQITVAVCFGALAFVLLITNVLELVRD